MWNSIGEAVTDCNGLCFTTLQVADIAVFLIIEFLGTVYIGYFFQFDTTGYCISEVDSLLVLCKGR